jgi:LacI family transcriptional regulator
MFLPRHSLGRIASELNLSATTVSRALSGKGRISASTRARILDHVRELDESAPGAQPTRFVMKRLIGLFTPWYSTGHGMLTSVSTSAVETLRSICEPRGYGVLFSSFGNPRQPTIADELLDKKLLAGLVLFRTRDEVKLSSDLPDPGLPHIYVYRNLVGTSLNYVGIDLQEAIELAVDHCLEIGGANLTLFCGDSSYPSHGTYKEHFFRLAGERGFAAGAEEMELCESDGYETAKRALSAQGGPRAIICASDRLAIGVVRAATELRKRIPKDVAIVSMDGTPPTAYIQPALTVVRIPWVEMFTMAGRLLMEIVEGNSPVRQAAVQLRCELIVRESSAGPRGRR